ALGSQTVVVDTGGNWVVTFPSVIVFDHPHSIKVDQVMSVHNASTTSGFNMRTYFTPALHGHIFWSRDVTVETVLGNAPHRVVESMSQQNQNPISMGWNDFYGYEYLVTSSTPAQYAG
ncbi:MAG: hypothetical protein AAF493_29130, partial [Pseudomonadota bacterium]